MKVSKEEIKRVEEYQKLQKTLKELKEDLTRVKECDLIYCQGSWSVNRFNFDYNKYIQRTIERKIRVVKRKIKEMEEE